MARDLTPEEVAEVNRKALAFLERHKSVPQSEKVMDTSEKLSGAVGFQVARQEGDKDEDAGGRPAGI